MSTLPGEPARRDNGIEAAAYVLLRAVEPDLVASVLDALRDADIAAYATVPEGALTSSHDLWVASDSTGEARRIAARVHRDKSRVHLEPSDVDARFAALIEGFDGPSEVPDRVERQSDPPRKDDDKPTSPAPVASSWRAPSSDVSSLDDPPDDPDDHFVPPPVGPIRRPSKRAAVGIALLLVGCSILFFPTLFGLDVTTALVLGVLGAAAGVTVLILGLRPDRDDYDDGAVV